MQPSDHRDVVVVAGASGFIGRSLGPLLARRYRALGLSRRDREGAYGYERFVKCELLSLEETERAMQGARFAVYLVHSMLPAARLTQASFADLDLVCADNFARAAAKAGVERIVYLGGLMAHEDRKLSEHLRSRLEVEHVLGSTGVPVTVLRAGLVLGAEGSSYQIVSRLVRRLPLMICPKWTHTKTQPIALHDVVTLLDFAVGDETCSGGVFDVAAPEVVSYLEIMRRFAALRGLRRVFIGVPLFSPGLSRLWLSLVTGAPRALAGPLVESLRHEMTARDHALADAAGLDPTPFEVALADSLEEEKALTRDPFAYRRGGGGRARSTVVSVQRMKLPPGRDAAWVATEYPRWCSSRLRWFIRLVIEDDGTVRFHLRVLGQELLVFTPVPAESTSDRFVYRIEGGSLVEDGQSGTFEFREVSCEGDGQRDILTIVREYEPWLPWWIYRSTQAIAHLWIMHAYARTLARMH